MSVSQDIRRALEQRVASITGFPGASNRHWENVIFTPTPGIPWARMILVFDTQRPATRGSSPQIRHDGSFLCVLHFPEGTGTGAIDELADAVRAAFTVETVLNEGATNVRFDYSERTEGVLDRPWYVVTMTARWYTYATS